MHLTSTAKLGRSIFSHTVLLPHNLCMENSRKIISKAKESVFSTGLSVHYETTIAILDPRHFCVIARQLFGND